MDLKEAVRWYQLAANQGHYVSQNNLGNCYNNGRGVDVDLKEAVRWYKLAADQGHAISQNNLGLCYKKGRGVDKDLKEAARWYKLSADQGLALAQNNLGLCYQKGAGVSVDAKEAIRLYLLAADQGDAAAQYNAGQCYEHGLEGLSSVNAKAAVRYYRLAADQGYAKAQLQLGNCYEINFGVVVNLDEATRWYTLSADQGNKTALQALARLSDHRTDPSLQPMDPEAATAKTHSIEMVSTASTIPKAALTEAADPSKELENVAEQGLRLYALWFFLPLIGIGYGAWYLMDKGVQQYNVDYQLCEPCYISWVGTRLHDDHDGEGGQTRHCKYKVDCNGNLLAKYDLSPKGSLASCNYSRPVGTEVVCWYDGSKDESTVRNMWKDRDTLATDGFWNCFGAMWVFIVVAMWTVLVVQCVRGDI
jgi:TPR repeat protein